MGLPRCYALSREHPGWTQFRFGCWDGVNPDTDEVDGQTPLCPAFLTADEIQTKEKGLSKQFFAAQYLCEPVAAEEALFDDQLIVAATDSSVLDDGVPDGPEIVLWDRSGG